ncbi:Type III pantothenate kinase [Tepidimonas thermarum]|uniref:Type III pantothenate kinase n=1 Tax=Tepidimonas thermarum TaxID=335431 RepID=A0A554WYA9_9BURK|nr:type III pantothenate kinase [Tepidimonas thermarum]TSE28545.1 Type III pantothenate kinase [Tepidimonas thermarum]
MTAPDTAAPASTALLALDVGNTRLKWALYDRPEPGARLLAHGVQFLENIETLAEGDWRALRPPRWVLGSIVAGAGVRQRVEEQLELWDAPVQWVVPRPAEAGLVNGYDHPTRLGSDRWVAMIGARQRLLARGEARPCVVVMVGTAVTVEAIDAEGRFLGGIILPGHGIMLRALESGTAGLHVPTGEVRAFPTNTSDALTSGGTFAIAGAVQRMWDNLSRHTGQTPVCLMTGGAGWKMAPHMTVPFELVEGLIFDGLLAMARERFAASMPARA